MSKGHIDPKLQGGWISPLTDKEHATLGRIAVLWGQIESCIDFILPAFCDLGREELDALGVYDKPMAAKVNFLEAVSSKRAAEAVNMKVRQFTKIIKDTKVQRNHAFHSMWGWRVDDRKKTVEPCARKLKNPEQGLRPAQLRKLERDLCECARHGKDLLHIAMGEGPDYNPTRFFHGKSEPQEWFAQWITRNPAPLDNLDFGKTGGELPRLRDPHPER